VTPQLEDLRKQMRDLTTLMQREHDEHNRKWREMANKQLDLLMQIAQLEGQQIEPLK
jgi:hypothetical protein